MSVSFKDGTADSKDMIPISKSTANQTARISKMRLSGIYGDTSETFSISFSCSSAYRSQLVASIGHPVLIGCLDNGVEFAFLGAITGVSASPNIHGEYECYARGIYGQYGNQPLSVFSSLSERPSPTNMFVYDLSSLSQASTTKPIKEVNIG